jgi:serine/threonine protein kinase
VIAYELLTGIAPFPFDFAAAMKAQQEGVFVPLRDQREDIPAALAALVEQMMARQPRHRPNAFTLTSSLLPCLERNDWRELKQLGESAYLEEDLDDALASLERAALIALPGDRATVEYGEMAQLLVETASSSGALFRMAPQLVQPVFQTACAIEGEKGTVKPMGRMIETLIDQPLVDPGDKESVDLALDTLIELLLENAPSKRLGPVVALMLKGQSHPLLWKKREDLYLVGTQYRRDGAIAVGVV